MGGLVESACPFDNLRGPSGVEGLRVPSGVEGLALAVTMSRSINREISRKAGGTVLVAASVALGRMCPAL
jgi:hypothetical protein